MLSYSKARARDRGKRRQSEEIKNEMATTNKNISDKADAAATHVKCIV